MKFALPLLFVAAAAFARENPNYVIELDWKDSKTLNDNVVQLCDDTNYPAVEIVIPGEVSENFNIEMNVDIGRGKISPGCTVKVKKGRSSTTYIFDAVNGGCSIQVHKVRKNFKEKPQSASYEISDAC